jgi:hypothetical protein
MFETPLLAKEFQIALDYGTPKFIAPLLVLDPISILRIIKIGPVGVRCRRQSIDPGLLVSSAVDPGF